MKYVLTHLPANCGARSVRQAERLHVHHASFCFRSKQSTQLSVFGLCSLNTMIQVEEASLLRSCSINNRFERIHSQSKLTFLVCSDPTSAILRLGAHLSPSWFKFSHFQEFHCDIRLKRWAYHAKNSAWYTLHNSSSPRMVQRAMTMMMIAFIITLGEIM